MVPEWLSTVKGRQMLWLYFAAREAGPAAQAPQTTGAAVAAMAPAVTRTE
jgi:hypothetical protein